VGYEPGLKSPALFCPVRSEAHRFLQFCKFVFIKRHSRMKTPLARDNGNTAGAMAKIHPAMEVFNKPKPGFTSVAASQVKWSAK
jgi:hypothetical protein